MNAAPHTRRVLLLVAVCLYLGVPRAQAMWPFGESKNTQAEAKATKGNTELRAADDAWRAGQLPLATELYQAAAAEYRAAEELKPGLENGLIRFRLSYCLSQVDQMHDSAKPAVAPERVAVTHPAATVPLRQTTDGSAAPTAVTPAAGAPEPAPAVVDAPRTLAAARQAMSSGNLDAALPLLVQVLHSEPTSRQALMLMTTVRIQQGRYTDAIMAIESLRGGINEDEPVLLLAAGAYCGAGRYFDALLALDKVLKANPNLPQAYIDMAYLLTEMTPEKRSDALAYYQHAVRLGVPRDALLEKRLGIQNP